MILFPIKPGKVIFIVFFLVSLIILLAGCVSASSSPNNRKILDWKYSDLKLIDPVDAALPDHDLIATYARLSDKSLQLRFDFLDLDKYLGKNIYVPIDTNPGGEGQIAIGFTDPLASNISWDYLIIMKDSGGVDLVDSHYKSVNLGQLFIIYDSEQDRIVMDISRSSLPSLSSQTKYQVFITSPGTDAVVDKSDTFSTNTPSPTRGKVLFAFWNTFSSDTPAQTLRSWAGAHTGPMSSRHGLKYLINAADRTDTTVFLLDLLTPKNLSALDYLNALPRVKNLADRGVLGLPASYLNAVLGKSQSDTGGVYTPAMINNLSAYPGWITQSDLANIDTLVTFDMSYLKNGEILFNSIGHFDGGNDYAQLSNEINTCALLPSDVLADNFNEDLSVNCKELLLSTAINLSPSALILGGDFSNSAFGDPLISSRVFSYIAVHPWLQVITIDDLAANGQKPILSGSAQDRQDADNPRLYPVNIAGLTGIQSSVYTALLESPRNQLTYLSWQVYDSLIQPGPSELLSLKQNYIGQIGEILAAANWAAAPADLHSCSIDLDYDGKNECILSNSHIFAVIEPDGGYIPFVFAIDDKGIHQVIGPTWEFMVGLSDPSSWDTSSGVRADPAQLLGVFQDNYENWNEYAVVMEDNSIDLIANDLTMRKSIAIEPGKLIIGVQSDTPSQINLSIPLVIDPWQRYTPHWGDTYSLFDWPLGTKWGIINGETVGVSSVNNIQAYTFNATRKAMSSPEDPNFDYLPGHYLPFPMAVVEVTGSDILSVDITVNP